MLDFRIECKDVILSESNEKRNCQEDHQLLVLHYKKAGTYYTMTSVEKAAERTVIGHKVDKEIALIDLN
jgi:hypothetical protein